MREKKSNRTRIIGLRLTPEEFAKIEKKWQQSTCAKLSDYVRQRLFDKAIIKTYRNLSMDEIMAEMSLLRTELNRIGNNINQIARKANEINSIYAEDVEKLKKENAEICRTLNLYLSAIQSSAA